MTTSRKTHAWASSGEKGMTPLSVTAVCPAHHSVVPDLGTLSDLKLIGSEKAISLTNEVGIVLKFSLGRSGGIGEHGRKS